MTKERTWDAGDTESIKKQFTRTVGDDLISLTKEEVEELLDTALNRKDLQIRKSFWKILEKLKGNPYCSVLCYSGFSVFVNYVILLLVLSLSDAPFSSFCVYVVFPLFF